MKQHVRSFLTLSVAAGALALAGCASSPGALPTYDANASAATQAATFIGDQGSKKFKGVSKIALTACNIMFATSSSAHASTSAGLFGDVGNNRVDAKVSTHFTMEGLDNATMQNITNKLCADAETKLAAAGYEVMTFDELKKLPRYQTLSQSGTASPYEIKQGDSRYLVFTRPGDTVWDARYQTFGGGLKQGFKSVVGKDGEALDLLVGDELGIAIARLNIMVDFAEMSSDGDGSKGFLGGLASKNSANVSGEALLSVSGGLDVRFGSQISCYKNLAGNRGCVDKGHTSFVNKLPINSTEKFYTNISNVTTVKDKASTAVVNVLAMLSSSGSTQSITRYRVDVTPEGYKAVQQKLADGLVEMAIERSKAFR